MEKVKAYHKWQKERNDIEHFFDFMIERDEKLQPSFYYGMLKDIEVFPNIRNSRNAIGIANLYSCDNCHEEMKPNEVAILWCNDYFNTRVRLGSFTITISRKYSKEKVLEILKRFIPEEHFHYYE